MEIVFDLFCLASEGVEKRDEGRLRISVQFIEEVEDRAQQEANILAGEEETITRRRLVVKKLVMLMQRD